MKISGGARRIVSFDWAIKHLFRDKSHFDVLEGFLSALLKRDVVIEGILESEGNQDDAALKYNRVDVLAKLDGDERVIVEVQYESEVGFIKRLLFGAAKAIVENLTLGEPFDQVKKVYSVSIVHFNVGDGDDYVYHGRTVFTGIHTRSVLKLKDKLTLGKIAGQVPKTVSGHDVFPEYYLIPLACFHDLVNDDLDQWVYAIKNAEVPESFQAPKIDRMRDKLDLLNMNPRERRAYEKYLEAKGSDKGTLEDARAVGREEGRVEGEAKGVRHVAAQLLANGVDIHTISTCTGLSPEEIRQLDNGDHNKT